jgi:hypothetical protein
MECIFCHFRYRKGDITIPMMDREKHWKTLQKMMVVLVLEGVNVISLKNLLFNTNSAKEKYHVDLGLALQKQCI